MGPTRCLLAPTDRHTNGWKERKAGIQIDRKSTDRHTERYASGQKHRDQQTDRRTDWQVDVQADRNPCKYKGRQADQRTDKNGGSQTDV